MIEPTRVSLSRAGNRYIEEAWRLIAFRDGLYVTAAQMDRMTCIVRHGMDCHRGENAHAGMSRHKASLEYDIIVEMQVEKTVNNFLAYLAEVYVEVAKTQPMMLLARPDDDEGGGGRAVPIETVLNATDRDEILAFVATSRARGMIHQSTEKLNKFLGKHFGPDPLGDKVERDRIAEYIATRNIVTHNRGYVNDEYMRTARAVPEGLSVGQHRFGHGGDPGYTADLGRHLQRVVLRIDEYAVRSFRLATEDANVPTDTHYTVPEWHGLDEVRIHPSIRTVLDARERGEIE